jgi:hypothetical protein
VVEGFDSTDAGAGSLQRPNDDWSQVQMMTMILNRAKKVWPMFEVLRRDGPPVR